MNANRQPGAIHAAHEAVATLVRSVPVRVVEVSRSGCRLECSSRLECGTSGQLAVEFAGLLRIDDIRVARCQQRMGAGAVYQVGAELLRTRRLGRRTVRMAIRNLISGGPGGGHARYHEGVPVLADVRTGETSGTSHDRAPPVAMGRGS